MIYLIGSLRNPAVPRIANRLRREGWDIFEDWHAAGRHGDREWQRYEMGRGRKLKEALSGLAAQHTFRYDRRHLKRASAAVLVAPAGKSAHLELGWVLGKGKRGYVLFDTEPQRWDCMYLFATAVHTSLNALIADMKKGRVK